MAAISRRSMESTFHDLVDFNYKADRGGEVFRIVGIETDGRVSIRHHTDAKPYNKQTSKEYQERYGVPARQTLTKLKSRLVKVNVDVLGNITVSGDIALGNITTDSEIR